VFGSEVTEVSQRRLTGGNLLGQACRFASARGEFRLNRPEGFHGFGSTLEIHDLRVQLGAFRLGNF
jgi:hypothetical protein